MATELDQDKARAAGVAVPPTSKKDYLGRAADPRVNFLPTADADDPHVGHTAVTGFGPDPDDMPGQVYAPSQLPDPAAAARAGFPPVQIPEHLILDNDDDVHPQGPEPSERAIIRERTKLRGDVVDRADKAAAAKAAAREGKSSSEAPAATETAPSGEQTEPSPANPDPADSGDGSGSSSSRRGSRSRSSS